MKKVFWKIAQNSQKNACLESFFLVKLQVFLINATEYYHKDNLSLYLN